MDMNTDNTDTPHSDELLTIPQAAATLGIHEKRLRRLLARPEYRDRMVTQARETRTGTRSAAMASKTLIEELSLLFESKKKPDNRDTDNKDAKPDISPRTGTGTRKRSIDTVATATRLLAEKDARIADLKAALQQEQEQRQAVQAEMFAQRQARDQADNEFRRLLLRQDAEIARLQQENRLLLAAPLVEEPIQAAQEPRTAQVETETGNPPPEQPRDGQSATGLTRKWWQFWR
jgi:hypothetical protein